MWFFKKISLLSIVAVSLAFHSTTHLAGCFEITGVDHPATVNVDETFTIEVDAKLTGKDGSFLVVGFLAPRAWKAAENTTVSYTSTVGDATLELMDPEEVDAENKTPWAEQVTQRVGFGQNYGEVEWIMFRSFTDHAPPSSTGPDNPVTGTITIQTKAGSSNMVTNLGFFLGEAVWGYLNDDSNSTFFFPNDCIEVTGGSGLPQILCGPAPRNLVDLELYTFEDIIPIIFDAKEDDTPLIGADKVYFCSKAIYETGEKEVCEISAKTEMQKTGDEFWTLTIWPPSYYGIPEGSTISELSASFQNESGSIVVIDEANNADFQILTKCF